MSWSKAAVAEEELAEVTGGVAAEAEAFYRSGRMHCAEAVLAAVKNRFAPELPEQVVKLAAGFGGGSGAGCICGAVSGGTMAFGLVLDGDKGEVGPLTKELHRWFKEEYRVTCCKVLTAKGKGGCLELTAKVAGKVAEMLARKGC